METAISIIVPIYNAENFIASCIESILAQTFTNFELILIDDGSEDASLAICERYRQNDSRIIVIHKGNEGVTAARKLGVEKSNGEYICFVDADDTVPENSLSILYKEHENTDIVIGNYTEITSSDCIKNKIPRTGKLDGLEFISLQLENKLYHAPWGKLIRKTCFDENIFTTPQAIFRGEDLIMNIKLGLKIQNAKVVDSIVYHYIIRSSSCMQSRKPTLEYEKMYDQYLMQILAEKNLETKLKKQVLSQRINSLTGLLLERIPLNKNDRYVNKIFSQLEISSFDIKQILLKTLLPYPALFNFFYRACRKLSIITP